MIRSTPQWLSPTAYQLHDAFAAMTPHKQRPLHLRQASAYCRNAAKAEKAGNFSKAAQFRPIADRKVEEDRIARQRLEEGR